MPQVNLLSCEPNKICKIETLKYDCLVIMPIDRKQITIACRHADYLICCLYFIYLRHKGIFGLYWPAMQKAVCIENFILLKKHPLQINIDNFIYSFDAINIVCRN